MFRHPALKPVSQQTTEIQAVMPNEKHDRQEGEHDADRKLRGRLMGRYTELDEDHVESGNTVGT